MPIYYAEPQIAIPDSKFLYQSANLLLRWTTNSDSRFQTLAPKCQSITLNQNSDSRFHSLMLNRPNYIAPRTAIPDSKLLHWIAKLYCYTNSDSRFQTLTLNRPNYIVPQTAIPDSKLLHWTAKLCSCANSDSWMLETLILDSKLLTVILGKVHSLFFTLTYGISLLLEMFQLYLNHGNLSCWIEQIGWVDRKIWYLRMFMGPRNP